jgi:predicted translin family RNA/ssDNA-binding protein
MRLQLEDIVGEVRRVLLARKGKWTSAYRILKMLPKVYQIAIAAQYGKKVGKGAGKYYSGATFVAQAAAIVADQQRYKDLEVVTVNGQAITPGNPTIAIFRCN